MSIPKTPSDSNCIPIPAIPCFAWYFFLQIKVEGPVLACVEALTLPGPILNPFLTI